MLPHRNDVVLSQLMGADDVCYTEWLPLHECCHLVRNRRVVSSMHIVMKEILLFCWRWCVWNCTQWLPSEVVLYSFTYFHIIIHFSSLKTLTNNKHQSSHHENEYHLFFLYTQHYISSLVIAMKIDKLLFPHKSIQSSNRSPSVHFQQLHFEREKNNDINYVLGLFLFVPSLSNHSHPSRQ